MTSAGNRREKTIDRSRARGQTLAMRFALILLLSLFALPALAQGWGHYDNARFGYGLDIPPGFVGQGESGNGDGQAFALAGKPIALLVWGGLLAMTDFEGEVAARLRDDAQAGWSLTYQAVTPRWASWSGQKGSRILYRRLVALCDGASYGAFSAEYSIADRVMMDAAVERMAGSLRGAC